MTLLADEPTDHSRSKKLTLQHAVLLLYILAIFVRSPFNITSSGDLDSFTLRTCDTDAVDKFQISFLTIFCCLC